MWFVFLIRINFLFALPWVLDEYLLENCDTNGTSDGNDIFLSVKLIQHAISHNNVQMKLFLNFPIFDDLQNVVNWFSPKLVSKRNLRYPWIDVNRLGSQKIFHYLSLGFLHVFSQRGTKVKIFTPLYDHLYCRIDKKTIKKMVHSETSTVYDIGQIKHCRNT